MMEKYLCPNPNCKLLVKVPGNPKNYACPVCLTNLDDAERAPIISTTGQEIVICQTLNSPFYYNPETSGISLGRDI